MQLYTIGEIFRGKLLLSHLGTPYTSKAAILHIANKLGTVDKTTPWGMARCLSDQQIETHNKNWASMGTTGDKS